MPGRILVDTTPLRESRDFRLLFTGQLISILGTQLTVVAIPYQVYSMTHSSLQVGAISLAQLIPFLVGALCAGPVGDAVDKRRIMVWTAVALTLTSGAMAVNAAVAHPSLVVLYVVSALAAGLMGFSNTARMASVPGMVERRHLTAAAAMTQIVFQVGVIVGPALSGVLLGIGLPLVYALDAVSFVVAAVTSAMLARSRRPRRRRPLAVAVHQGGAALPALAPGAAGRLPDRHQRHGVRHAPGPLPRHGRRGLRRRDHHPGLPLRRARRRARSSARSPPGGWPTCAGRAGP